MKIGYIRVSTEEQNTIRQEVLMQELGVDEIYIDKASGRIPIGLSLKRCCPMSGAAIRLLLRV